MKTLPHKEARFMRDIEVQDVKMQDENVLTFSVASSEPYVRYDDKAKYFKNPEWYNEVLVISEEAIDFKHLIDQRCPFLFEHDTQKQLGVVEKAYIAYEKLYVVVRFSDNFEAQEILNDIKSGIRRNVSIGYDVNGVNIVREQGSSIPTIYVTDWMPFECSSVSCPADPTVGYQRSLDKKGQAMKKTHIKGLDLTEEEMKKLKELLAASEDEKEEAAEDQAEAQAEVVEEKIEEDKAEEAAEDEKEETKEEEAKPEEEKACGDEKEEEKKKAICPDCGQDPCVCEEEEIRSLGDLLNKRDMAEDFIKNKRSLKAFKSALRDNKDNKEKTMEKKYFSLRKLIASEAGLISKDAASYERSICEENSRKYNRNDGFIIERRNTRAFDGTEALNQPNYIPDMYTPNLRPPVTIDAIGTQKLTFDPGRDVDFTVAVSGINAAFGDLNDALASSAMAFETRRISPKNEGTWVQLSHQSLLQDDPSVEGIVTDDIFKSLDQKKDYAFWNGTNANKEPNGLLTISGVNEVTLPATPTLSTALAFEQKIRESYDYSGDLKWVMGTGSYYKWASTPYYNGAENRMLIEDRKCIGYDVYVDPNMPTSAVVLGNFNEAIEADFGPTVFIFDALTLASQKAVKVYAWQDLDFCFRRPKSFTKGI